MIDMLQLLQEHITVPDVKATIWKFGRYGCIVDETGEKAKNWWDCQTAILILSRK